MRRTKFLRLTIEATYLDQKHWFVDTIFAVHNNMQSHTCAYATFGKSMLDRLAKGQRINIIEVVGVHESMPDILWMCYVLVAQGYPLRPTQVHQDTVRDKQLETNRRASSSKRTRHMNIRYFFVTDVQKCQHITIEY